MSVPSNNNSLVPEERNFNIENRNFLSPVGFKFTINKMRGVDFFCQSASIPSISMGSANQGTRFNAIPHPGDELNYEDLFIKFMVDENLKNWQQVHDWMRGITTPYSESEFTYSRDGMKSRYRSTRPISVFGDNDWRSDCSLFVLSSNYQPVAEFIFRDAFPINLSTVTFDSGAGDADYISAETTLKYTYYDYYIYEAAEATDASMEPTYRTSNRGTNVNSIGL